MSQREVLRRQAQEMLTRGEPAYRHDQVVCCGHALGAHDDDGCTVGWQHPEGQAGNGCPCRVRGWASS